MRVFIQGQGGDFVRLAVYDKYMRIVANYPTLRLDKKTINL